MDRESGPYLAFAVVCEKVLQEKDETLSFIRVIDRFTVAAPDVDQFPELPHLSLPVTVALGFRSGAYAGTRGVDLRIHTPSGDLVKTGGDTPLPLPVFFQGGEAGANLVMSLTLDVSTEGLYWIDVLLDEDLITRLPVRIVHQQVVPQPPEQSAHARQE